MVWEGFFFCCVGISLTFLSSLSLFFPIVQAAFVCETISSNTIRRSGDGLLAFGWVAHFGDAPCLGRKDAFCKDRNMDSCKQKQVHVQQVS